MTDESNTPRKARYFRYKKMFLELTDRYKELQLQFERRPIVYVDKVVDTKEDWESLWISRELWNELNMQNTALRAELAGLKDKMRWIPVGERLPDDNDDVLVWRVEGYHEIGCHSSGLWWGGTFMDEAIYITHWMPLPEPPEVENE